MIQIQTPKTPIKAVGLISGGLDSVLAAKVIKDLGFDVYGVYFAMPWGCCDKTKAIEAAQAIGIKFIVLQLDERYLEMVRKPKHGYGSAMNPCIDCRIHMFSRAAKYMKEIGAEFCFTGEVLGQRPMSQKKHSMKWIEEESGLKGRLLRPLSAQLLDPTEIELNGIIDRSKLLRINGRSRKEQLEMVKDLNVSEFNQPAGGCLLTDENFAKRMRDTLKHGYRNFRETVALKWGRHFRINEEFKAVLGRYQSEEASLINYAHPDDFVLFLETLDGPICILKGPREDKAILELCAGLIKKFSRYKNSSEQIKIKYYQVKDKNNLQDIYSSDIPAETVEKMYV